MKEKEIECPRCGMPQEDWPHKKGHREGNATYCCESCAFDTGCTCS